MASIRITGITGKPDFIIDKAEGLMLAKQGDDLRFMLDGRTEIIDGFYKAVSEKTSFAIDGQEVEAKDFFVALGSPDLVPAAGPQRQQVQKHDSNRFHEYEDADVLSGVDHLGALDYSSNWGYEHDMDEHADPIRRDAPRENHGVIVFPIRPDSGIQADSGSPIDPDDATTQGMLVSLREANLSDGTDPDGSSLMKTGEIIIEAPDGVSRITLGGVDVPVSGEPVKVPSENGILTVRYEAECPGKGKLVFTFELIANDDHPSPGPDATFTDLVLEVTDPDGDRAQTVIRIEIIDDVPEAADDSALIEEGGTASAEGNVLDNDTAGADGLKGLDWNPNDAPKYGEIVRNPDGAWEYRLDPDNPDVLILKDGESLTETFRYVITDGDGDTAVATLTITIDGANHDVKVIPEDPDPEVPGDPDRPSDPDDPDDPAHAGNHDASVTVFEKNLADGSDPDAAALAKRGAIDISASDGVKTIEINGHFMPLSGEAVKIATDEGVFTLSYRALNAREGKLEYEFILGKSTIEHEAQGADRIFHDLRITVTDLDGDQGTTTLRVNVIDDVPEAANDLIHVFEGETKAASGNVFANDTFGADGPKSIEWLDTEAAHGKIVLNQDGTWSYELDNLDPAVLILKDGEHLTEIFRYVITDKDGDTSQAELAIVIDGANHPIKEKPEDPDPEVPGDPDKSVDPDDPCTQGASATVFEKNLPDGSLPDEARLTVSDAVRIEALDGLASITAAGANIPLDGSEVRVLANRGEYVFRYEADNIKCGRLIWSFTLKEVDSHPDQGDDALPYDIPVAVKDLDGDSAMTTIRVKIVDDVPEAADDSASTTERMEASIAGNIFENDIWGADGRAEADGLIWKDAIMGEDGPGVITSAWGRLEVKPDGTWEYFLDNDNPDLLRMEDGDETADVFHYVITDKDGDTSPATLTIAIRGKDDGVTVAPDHPDPEFPGDTDKDLDPDDPSTQGAQHTVREEHLSAGTHPGEGDLVAGNSIRIDAPDGVDIITVNGVDVYRFREMNGKVIETDEWKMEFNYRPDDIHGGHLHYKFTLKDPEAHNAQGMDRLWHDFIVGVQDLDGDSAKTTIRINVIDDTPEAKGDTAEITERTEASISGDIFANDTWGADGRAKTDGLIWKDAIMGEDGKGVITSAWGRLEVKPDGTWEYFLDNDNPDLLRMEEGDEALDIFHYVITDADGDTSPATLTLTIHGKDDGVTIIPGTPDPEFPGDTDKDLDPDDPSTQGAQHTIREEYLPSGTKAGEGDLAVGNSIRIDAPDGVDIITINGIEVYHFREMNGKTIETDEWKMEFDYRPDDIHGGHLHYKFTLKDPEAHNAQGMDRLWHDFIISVKDLDDDTAQTTLRINIIDDVPEAKDDTAKITERTEEFVEGKVLANDAWGADGRAETDGLTWKKGADGDDVMWDAEGRAVITSGWGRLEVQRDGSWRYFLDNDNPELLKRAEGEDTFDEFHYVIMDDDGDTSPAVLKIKIFGKDDEVFVKPDEPDPEIPGDTEKDLDLSDPRAQGAQHEMREEFLHGGTEAGKGPVFHSSSISIDAPDGVESITVNGVEVYRICGGNGASFGNDDWTMTFRYEPAPEGKAGIHGGKLHYTFTLRGAEGHDAAHPDKLIHDFEIGVKDLDGDSARTMIRINVIDDAPQAENDEGKVAERGKLTAAGDVSSNDMWGADGHAESGWLAWDAIPDAKSRIDGRYGWLTVDNEGNWTYQLDMSRPETLALKSGQVETETFGYTIMDGDGDMDHADLAIRVSGASGPVDVTHPSTPGIDVSEAVVRESKLAGGTGNGGEGKSASDELDISAPDGVESISISAYGQTWDIPTDGSQATFQTPAGAPQHGTFTFRYAGDMYGGKLAYTFTLSGTSSHAQDAGENILSQDLIITVRNYEDKTDTGIIRVKVIDDIPVLTNVEKGNDSAADGSYDASLSGTFRFQFGADGAAASKEMVIMDGASEIAGIRQGAADRWTFALPDNGSRPAGVLTVQKASSGAWEYRFAPGNQSAFNDFSVTLIGKDADGDAASGTFTIYRYLGPTINDRRTQVDAGRFELDEGEQPQHGGDAHPNSGTGSFRVDLHGDAGTIMIGSGASVASISIVKSGDSLIAGAPQGSFTNSGVRFDILSAEDLGGGEWGISYAWKYVADGGLKHGSAASAHTLSPTVDVKVTSSRGLSADGKISMDIHDDVPIAVPTAASTAIYICVTDSDGDSHAKTMILNSGTRESDAGARNIANPRHDWIGDKIGPVAVDETGAHPVTTKNFHVDVVEKGGGAGWDHGSLLSIYDGCMSGQLTMTLGNQSFSRSITTSDMSILLREGGEISLNGKTLAYGGMVITLNKMYFAKNITGDPANRDGLYLRVSEDGERLYRALAIDMKIDTTTALDTGVDSLDVATQLIQRFTSSGFADAYAEQNKIAFTIKDDAPEVLVGYKYEGSSEYTLALSSDKVGTNSALINMGVDDGDKSSIIIYSDASRSSFYVWKSADGAYKGNDLKGLGLNETWTGYMADARGDPISGTFLTVTREHADNANLRAGDIFTFGHYDNPDAASNVQDYLVRSSDIPATLSDNVFDVIRPGADEDGGHLSWGSVYLNGSPLTEAADGSYTCAYGKLTLSDTGTWTFRPISQAVKGIPLSAQQVVEARWTYEDADHDSVSGSIELKLVGTQLENRPATLTVVDHMDFSGLYDGNDFIPDASSQSLKIAVKIDAPDGYEDIAIGLGSSSSMVSIKSYLATGVNTSPGSMDMTFGQLADGVSALCGLGVTKAVNNQFTIMLNFGNAISEEQIKLLQDDLILAIQDKNGINTRYRIDVGFKPSSAKSPASPISDEDAHDILIPGDDDQASQSMPSVQLDMASDIDSVAWPQTDDLANEAMKLATIAG